MRGSKKQNFYWSWVDPKLTQAGVCPPRFESWSTHSHLVHFSFWVGCVLEFWRFFHAKCMFIPLLRAEAEAQSGYGVFMFLGYIASGKVDTRNEKVFHLNQGVVIGTESGCRGGNTA
jgi:hypothetical protein